jgi:hypothetical protein
MAGEREAVSRIMRRIVNDIRMREPDADQDKAPEQRRNCRRGNSG